MGNLCKLGFKHSHEWLWAERNPVRELVTLCVEEKRREKGVVEREGEETERERGGFSLSLPCGEREREREKQSLSLCVCECAKQREGLGSPHKTQKRGPGGRLLLFLNIEFV